MKELIEALEGANLCGLSDEEKSRYLGSTNRDLDDLPIVRVNLVGGRNILAEGPFQHVAGFLKVWTPFEDETFMLLNPTQIVSMEFSE